MTQSGQFWCKACQTSYPDTIEEQHLKSHEQQTASDDRFDLMAGILFIVLCAAIGAVAALIVTHL